MVTAAARPKITVSALAKPTLSPKEALAIELDQPDEVFDYYIRAGSKRQQCRKASARLTCEVEPLALAQGTPYKVGVERFFANTKVADVVERQVTTTSPVTVVGSSVAHSGTVYDVPKELRLTASKPLLSAEVLLHSVGPKGERQVVEQKTSVSGADIVVGFAQPLARNVTFEAVVMRAVAADKGFLEQPYTLPFNVSGGPRVVGVNIGRGGVAQSPTIVITFDQVLGPGQDLAKLVNMRGAGGPIAITVGADGRQISLRPTVTLPLCSTFTVQLGNDIKSNFGIGGNSAWSYNSRVICYTISTIGYSVRGRAIQAWRFGSGASKVVYVGNTHGDEKSSKYLLDYWIAQLEANPDKIPAHRSIIVIPTINPDGYAAGSRRNAGGVDLNRNFPASDWKANVSMPSGEVVANGGGVQPLSEPESRALANFVQSERPRLVLTYHSVASIVSGNGAGDSSGLAATYSRQSGYGNLAAGETGSVFHYDTTGAFETWLYDKVGIPALLVELGSHTSAETSRNFTAMWTMAQL
jgi:hypothetical protein